MATSPSSTICTGSTTSIDQTTGELDPDSNKRWKVGGGWTPEFTYFEESRYSGRTNTYALRGGVISRWTVDQRVWRNKATYTGYSAVKTMALISQTRTYDTFLANTRGGALYTIRIPLSGTPVVKQVRASTWQAFDTLIAEKCGNQSTLLLGIDKDTRTAYLYAVSHANGTATVIKGLGQAGSTIRRLLRQDVLPLLRRRLRSPNAVRRITTGGRPASREPGGGGHYCSACAGRAMLCGRCYCCVKQGWRGKSGVTTTPNRPRRPGSGFTPDLAPSPPACGG